MSFQSRRSSWVQYAMIGTFGYLMGCLTPFKILHETSQALFNSRYLEEVPEEQEGEHAEDEERSGFDATIVTCIVLLLIFLTITFEFCKEHLEERAARNLRPLVDKLFGEMTVLGFLSVVTFAITKAGWFTDLSEIFFAEDNELLEIFEFVHFTIFFIMLFFVIQVLILVAGAMDIENEWIDMDRTARAPVLLEEWGRRAESYYDHNKAESRQSFLRGAREVITLLPGMRDRKAQRQEDLILFKALRDEFLLERSPIYPFHPVHDDRRVSPDFNFGRYLGINQGSLLAQVGEVSIITWTLYAFLTVIYYLYVISVNANIVVLAWSWVAIGWSVYFCNIAFERHLIQVRKMFLKKAKVDNDENGNSLLDADETTFLNSLVADSDDNFSLPMWTEIDIDEFHQKQSWLTKLLVGEHANRQHAIYLLNRRGPKVYMLLLQANLLFLGIYAAMTFLGFFRFMYQEESTLVFAAYAILASFPLLGIMFFKQHLVAILSQVCCMGAYRRPNIVADVLLEEKTARVVRAFIVIYKMRRFAVNADKSEYDRGLASVERMHFDKFELKEVGKTFDAFDKSGDGSISYDEFESLMKNLGAEITEEGLNRMIGMLDTDGDGEVSKEEFINWYAEHANDDDLSEEERARFLFQMFDRDNSGEITIVEFKNKLDALNVGFTVDEADAIVNELDEDNSGSIGLHEFAHLLHSFYPKELQPARHERPPSMFFDAAKSLRR